MCIGWMICALVLTFIYFTELPEAYYCVGAGGEYLVDEPPCNPSAATRGGFYTVLMMMAAGGYVTADVAADGLTVQYAKSEPEAERGYVQTTAYLVRTLGQISSYCLVGFGMNSKAYLGTFERGLSFNQVRME